MVIQSRRNSKRKNPEQEQQNIKSMIIDNSKQIIQNNQLSKSLNKQKYTNPLLNENQNQYFLKKKYNPIENPIIGNFKQYNPYQIQKINQQKNRMVPKVLKSINISQYDQIISPKNTHYQIGMKKKQDTIQGNIKQTNRLYKLNILALRGEKTLI